MQYTYRKKSLFVEWRKCIEVKVNYQQRRVGLRT